MNQLHDLIGVETDLVQVNRALRQFAEAIGAPVVGGYQVTCSDEAEWECVQAFQQWFAKLFLPALKSTSRAPFRSINLGGRYEWGAIPIAEEHYATAASQDAFKLLVTKINAHVAVRQTSGQPEYGSIERYDRLSACCGALSALLDGAVLPALEELGKTFRLAGRDRLAVLRDQRTIAPKHRALLAAVTGARLQAEHAVLDITEYHPRTPTIFLVLPCVTINRPGPDTELVVGQYGVDWTNQTPQVKYRGLGDDPAGYRVRHERDRLRVEDDRWPGRQS